MKTLTDVKRRIRDGVRLVCVSNTRRPELNGQLRTVTKAQINGFFWLADGDHRRYWTPYPKAQDCIVEDDTFALCRGPGCITTMRFLRAEADA